MQTFIRILLFTLLCWCGYHAVRQTFEASVPGLPPYIFFIISIILSATVLVFDIKAYKKFPKSFQFYSSIAGVFICTVVIFRLVTINKMYTAATLFTVQKNAGKQMSLYLQFKENNYVVIQDMSTPLVHTWYGRYRYEKDSLVITQANYKPFAEALPFGGLVKNGMVIWKNGDTMTTFPAQ